MPAPGPAPRPDQQGSSGWGSSLLRAAGLVGPKSDAEVETLINDSMNHALKAKKEGTQLIASMEDDDDEVMGGENSHKKRTKEEADEASLVQGLKQYVREPEDMPSDMSSDEDL